MSFLLLLDMQSSSEEKLNNILLLLPKYQQKIEDSEALLKFEGRRLEEVMQSLPHLQSSYARSLDEMKALEEWVGVAKEKESARLWKKYLEGYPKALSSGDIKAYIGGEKGIIELNQIIIEISLLKNNLTSVVEAFKQVGWMTGNITRLRIAELQETVL